MSAIKKVMSSKYTFIFVPDVTSKFIRFSLPKALVKGGAAALALFVGAFVWFSYSILDMRSDLAKLDRLQAENYAHKTTIDNLKLKINRLEVSQNRTERLASRIRSLTELGPRPKRESEVGIGGPRAHSAFNPSEALDEKTVALFHSLDRDIDVLQERLEDVEASYFELDEYFREQSALLTHTPSIWPVRGMITSVFGYRQSPFTGLREMHEGLDIATQMNAPIIAPANGIVTRVSKQPGYGNFIEIDHGYGRVTRYGHNSKNLVRVGQKIRRGDLIARVGNTGRSTGPHLHYEVLLNGVPVNPDRFILND